MQSPNVPNMVVEVGDHWFFPIFFSVMMVVIAVFLVKYVFMSNKDEDK